LPGGTADAFTLFERFEGKLEKYGNLTRAAIELAKDWRSDRLPAASGSAAAGGGDADKLLLISGNGDGSSPTTTWPPSAPAGSSHWPPRARFWKAPLSMPAASWSAR